MLVRYLPNNYNLQQSSGGGIAKILSGSLIIGDTALSSLPALCVSPKPAEPSSPILRDAALDDLAATQNTRVGGLGASNQEKMELDTMATPRAMAFRLCSHFVNSEGRANKPRFGFNGLGELVYQRTYARYLGDDTNEKEQW